MDKKERLKSEDVKKAKHILIYVIATTFVLVMTFLYVITSPSGGACCDMPPGTSPRVQEGTYREYLWWERKNNFKNLFGL